MQEGLPPAKPKGREGTACNIRAQILPSSPSARRPLLPRFKLTPHTRHHLSVKPGELTACVATHVRITIFPDGGVSRLRVHGSLATSAKM